MKINKLKPIKAKLSKGVIRVPKKPKKPKTPREQYIDKIKYYA